MPGDLKKEDLRIKRTYKALMNAMLTMLSRKNFNQITVNDLCEEALISRATFYVRFSDKYDLLKYLLSDISGDVKNTSGKYEEIECMINNTIQENQKIITNILTDANTEALELIHDFISSILSIFLERNGHNPTVPYYTILINFCTGGIVNLILLQAKDNFSSGTDLMNPYLYSMLRNIIEQDNEQIIVEG